MRSLGIHWGTFQLTDEAPLEPVELLKEAKSEAGLGEDEFVTVRHGETIVW